MDCAAWQFFSGDRVRKPLEASDQLGGGMRSVVAVGKTAPLATSVVMGVSFFIDGGA
jgi:hypothetical protein